MQEPGNNFWQRRIVRPLKTVLLLGITPNKLALSLAVGWVTGTFPMLGVTIILCIGVCAIFRLNQIAAQVTNWLAYPVLFLLFIPHVRLGEFLCHAENMPISWHHLKAVAAQGVGIFLKTFGVEILFAALGWLALSPLVFVAVYVATLPLARRICSRIKKEAEPLGR